MSKAIRTALVCASAAAILAAVVGTASATHLSVNSRNIRGVWTLMEFIAPVGEAVRCHVTLEGSLHSSTIAKVAGALIGYITRGIVDSVHCAGGHATILQATLPWHVRYKGFLGTLPNITQLQTTVIGSSFLVEGTFGIECLYVSSEAEPTLGLFNITNQSTHAVANAEVSGEINSTTGCGIFGEHIRGRLKGTGTVTQLGSTAGITVTLI